MDIEQRRERHRATKKTLGKEHENSLLRILQHTHALIVEKTTQ